MHHRHCSGMCHRSSETGEFVCPDFPTEESCPLVDEHDISGREDEEENETENE